MLTENCKELLKKARQMCNMNLDQHLPKEFQTVCTKINLCISLIFWITYTILIFSASNTLYLTLESTSKDHLRYLETVGKDDCW